MKRERRRGVRGKGKKEGSEGRVKAIISMSGEGEREVQRGGKGWKRGKLKGREGKVKGILEGKEIERHKFTGGAN